MEVKRAILVDRRPDDLIGLLTPIRPALSPLPRPRRDVEAVASELAACLGRFLSATADEHTMRRANDALAAWADLSR